MKKKNLFTIFIIIWLIGIPVLMLLGNTIVSMVVNITFLENELDLVKYADKAESILDPLSLNDETKISPLSSLRVLLGSLDAKNPNLHFTVEKFSKFITRDGSTTLTEGTYALVIKNDSNDINVIKDSIGVIPVNDLIKENYASGLMGILEENENIKIKLDKYAINGTVIMPVSLSVLDVNNNKLASFEAQNISAASLVISADDVYIYNEEISVDSDIFLTYNVLNSMKLAKKDARKVDQIGEKLVSSININNPELTEYKNVSTGFGTITGEAYKVSDNYAYVIVDKFTYTYYLWLVIGAIFVLWTVIVVIIGLIVRNKKNKSVAKEEIIDSETE